MEQSITEWLKNSIPGIVILGAVGSIFAVVVLKVVGLLLERYVLQARSILLQAVLGTVRGPQLIIEHLKTSKEPRELTVSIALLLTVVILTCAGMVIGTLMVCLGAVASSNSAQTGQELAFMGSFITSICIILFWWPFRHLRAIYMIHMGCAEQKIKEQISNIVNSRDSDA